MEDQDSVLDKGMTAIGYGLRVIFGIIGLPLLLAFWELYVLFFLDIGLLALFVRFIFPRTRKAINRFFNASWKWAKGVSYKYGYYFFGEAFDKYW